MNEFYVYKIEGCIQYSAQQIIEKDNKIFLIESNKPVNDYDIVVTGKNLYDISNNDFYVMVVLDEVTKEIIVSYGMFSYCHSLYYYINNSNLYINISLHSLLKDTGITPSLDILGVNKFVRYGFIVGSGTLISQIKKVPALKTVIFKNGSVESIDSQYIERKSVGDYVDNLKISLPNKTTKSLIPLSGGFDSTLLTYLTKDYDTKLTVTVGSPNDPTSEFRNADRTAWCLQVPHEKIYCDNQWIEHFPEIVNVMEGEMFDPGVFLSYFLVDKIKSLGLTDYTFIMGDGSDEILNINFFSSNLEDEPDRSKYRKDFWLKNSKHCLYHVVTKKIEWLLRLNNINYTTPFISKEIYDCSKNTIHTEHKKEYKEFVKSYLPKSISIPLRTKGGVIMEKYIIDEDTRKIFLDILNLPKYKVLFDVENIIDDNLRNITYRMYIVLFNYIFIEGGSIEGGFDQILKKIA